MFVGERVANFALPLIVVVGAILLTRISGAFRFSSSLCFHEEDCGISHCFEIAVPPWAALRLKDTRAGRAYALKMKLPAADG